MVPHIQRASSMDDTGDDVEGYSRPEKTTMLPPGSNEAPRQENKGFLGLLSSLDAYPKVDPRYLRRTTPGGLTTIIVAIFLSVLFIFECIAFFCPLTKHEFIVDPVVSANLPIRLDISIATPCDDIVVQFIDPNGQSIIANRQLNANKIDYPLKINGTASSTEGCRISGSFPVNKVSGKIEIIPLLHMRLHLSGVIDLNLDDINFSHQIHHMSFGRDYPGQQNPLDQTFVEATSPLFMFQYFISIIPTWYRDVLGTVYESNQYAVNNYQRELSERKSGTPGIFFKYELDSIAVNISEEHTPFLAFIVHVVGILGGIFTCSGILHHLISWGWSIVSPETFIYEPVSKVLG